MPNWCDNELTITGNENDLDKFYEDNYRLVDYDGAPVEVSEAGKTGCYHLSFDRLIKDAGNCDKNVEQWGTKWDLDDALYCTRDEQELAYGMDTAWSPPTEWLKVAIAKYPTLRFKLNYHEDGCEFAGVMEGVNGEVITDECHEYTDAERAMYNEEV